MMTKQDFEIVAGALFATKPNKLEGEPEQRFYARHWQWDAMVKTMGEVLRQTNPRFDLRRFFVATGLEIQGDKLP